MQLRGTSLKEIIERLGVPSGTIYARSSRCREALKREFMKLLREQDEDA